MITSTHIIINQIFALIAVLVFKSLSCKVFLVINRKLLYTLSEGNFLRKLRRRMRIFLETFETVSDRLSVLLQFA